MVRPPPTAMVLLRQGIGVFGIAENADRLAGSANFGAPACRIHIELLECQVYLPGRDPHGLHPAGIERDQNFAIDPAAALDLGHARD